jgi:glutamate--cysteine ligase
MSIAAPADNSPIENREQLIRHFELGAKTKASLLIGTEHEKFTLDAETFEPVAYEGERGIKALLEGMQKFGYTPLTEGTTLVALERGRANITLEPAGQFELSGAPLTNLHETATELEQHYREVKEIAAQLGLVFVPVGYHPEKTVADMPWMPKGRYKIMREYMPKVGTRGLEMMVLTCTTQVNLDYVSEADMRRKMRVAHALSPIVSALFASSPFKQGKPNGFQTNRCDVWLDTDKKRSGIIQECFSDTFCFEGYVDYALDVPMYFVLRDGKYIDCSGQSFRDFLAGKLPALPGEKPNMGDWMNHLTTLFPDVRLKTYLEMRSADVGDPAMIMALPTFWVGLLYDDSTLNQCEAMIKEWACEDVQRLRGEVPTLGLKATINGKSLLEVSRFLVHQSTLGLRRRANRLNGGPDESRYLEPLLGILDREETQSDLMLRLYGHEWGGDIKKIYDERAL